MAFYVVTGPPCAGKSTWVEKKASPEDVVIDFDRIAVAISPPGAALHEHSDLTKGIAFAARAAAINRALASKAHVLVDVYVIHSLPSRSVLSWYSMSGAEIVTIDPGREVVEERARNERPEAYMEAVRAFYEDDNLYSRDPEI